MYHTNSFVYNTVFYFRVQSLNSCLTQIPHYTNCIYFLVQLKNKYAMVNADTT